MEQDTQNVHWISIIPVHGLDESFGKIVPLGKYI